MTDQRTQERIAAGLSNNFTGGLSVENSLDAAMEALIAKHVAAGDSPKQITSVVMALLSHWRVDEPK